MLVRLCVLQNLCNFGGSNVFGVNATKTSAFIVNLQHDAGGLFRVHMEEVLQHFDHKVHRGKIIV